LFEVHHHYGLVEAQLIQEGESIRHRVGESQGRELLPQCQNRLQVEDDAGGKPVYDRKGKMVQAAAFQKGEDETTPGRVQPDRR